MESTDSYFFESIIQKSTPWPFQNYPGIALTRARHDETNGNVQHLALICLPSVGVDTISDHFRPFQTPGSVSVHPLLRVGVGGALCCHLVLRLRAQVATARHSGVRKCHSRNTAQAPFRNFLVGFDSDIK
jgi:hypothetical protein